MLDNILNDKTLKNLKKLGIYTITNAVKQYTNGSIKLTLPRDYYFIRCEVGTDWRNIYFKAIGSIEQQTYDDWERYCIIYVNSEFETYQEKIETLLSDRINRQIYLVDEVVISPWNKHIDIRYKDKNTPDFMTMTPEERDKYYEQRARNVSQLMKAVESVTSTIKNTYTPKIAQSNKYFSTKYPVKYLEKVDTVTEFQQYALIFHILPATCIQFDHDKGEPIHISIRDFKSLLPLLQRRNYKDILEKLKLAGHIKSYTIQTKTRIIDITFTEEFTDLLRGRGNYFTKNVHYIEIPYYISQEPFKPEYLSNHGFKFLKFILLKMVGIRPNKPFIVRYSTRKLFELAGIPAKQSIKTAVERINKYFNYLYIIHLLKEPFTITMDDYKQNKAVAFRLYKFGEIKEDKTPEIPTTEPTTPEPIARTKSGEL